MIEKLNELINNLIMELNPELLDDDYPDACDDPENRNEAIDYLIELLTKQKEN